MMQQTNRQAISANRNTSGGVALSLSLDVEVQDGFHKNTEYFHSHRKISPYLSNRLRLQIIKMS